MRRIVIALLALVPFADCRAALYADAYQGFTKNVMEQLEAGVDVNAALPDDDNLERTALGWAAEGGQCKTVQWLLQYGADPNIGDRKGNTPAHRAAYAYIAELPSYKIGQKEYACVLLSLHQFGANLHQKNKGGDTPLHVAAHRGNFMLVLAMIDNLKVPIDIRGWREATPLYMAAWGGQPDIIKLLMKFGADPRARTEFGETWKDIWESEGKQALEERIAESKGAFDWTKFSALAVGGLIGGMAGLDPAKQVELVGAMLADSATGQEGASNTLATAGRLASAQNRNQSSQGAASTVAQPPARKTYSLQHTCPSGTKLDVMVPYRTEACRTAAVEFAKVMACNEAGSFSRVQRQCTQACGNQNCTEQ